MAPSMARLAMTLSIFCSLFLLLLACRSIDLSTKLQTEIKILLPEESNITVLKLDPNESTDLEIVDPIKKVEGKTDTQLSSLALPDELPQSAVVAESDPGLVSSMVIGWDPKEDEEQKQEEFTGKKKGKRMDESDSDSNSDSDSDWASNSDSDSDSDEEEEEGEEEEAERKRKRRRGKKGGFLRWFLKWILPL